VLAAAEVVAAVVAYWTIAIYFETTTHLWVSICVAPLLLLRSEQSVALGARWFSRGEVPLERDPRTLIGPVRFWIDIAIGLIAAAGFCYLVARHWLVGYAGWSLLWRSAMVGLMTVAIAPVMVPAIGVNWWVAGFAAARTEGPKAVVKKWAVPWLVVVFPQCVLNLSLWGTAIRFAATVRFLRSGFREIPTNFRQALFVIDLWHPVEFVPGYSGRFPNSTAELVRQFSTEGSTTAWFMGLVVFVFVFLPAYVYRLGIKSTCWLYLPLVYIASERDLATTPAHFADRLIRGGWEPW
jgi:hypothetical protein